MHMGDHAQFSFPHPHSITMTICKGRNAIESNGSINCNVVGIDESIDHMFCVSLYNFYLGLYRSSQQHIVGFWIG